MALLLAYRLTQKIQDIPDFVGGNIHVLVIDSEPPACNAFNQNLLKHVTVARIAL